MKRTLLFALCACLLLLSACAKRQPATQSAELPKAAQDAAETAEAAEEALPVTRLTLGTVDFDTEKDRLRGLIQLYNSAGAPVSWNIRTSEAPASERSSATRRFPAARTAYTVPNPGALPHTDGYLSAAGCRLEGFSATYDTLSRALNLAWSTVITACSC